MDSTGSDADYSAALPLEIDEATANEADNLLREFAELALLDTALVVDRSGALVAGISAEAEVTVEVISALVAGASGAMRALVSRLGETGAIESLHLGEERLIYLKEINDSFILVAVADTARPAALVRQSALSIEPRLSEVLLAVTPGPWPEPGMPPLHRIRPTAVATVIAPESEPDFEEEEFFESGGGYEDTEEDDAEEEEPLLPIDSLEPEPEESFADLDLIPETLDEQDPEIEEVSEEGEPFEEPTDDEEVAAPEPSGILEPIFDDEPEVVIEPAARANSLPVDSPFEADEEEDDDDDLEEDEDEWEPSGETPDDEDELPLTLSPASSDSPVFELEEDEEEAYEDEEVEEVMESPAGSDEEEETRFESAFNPFEEEAEEENIFEFDEEDEDEDDDGFEEAAAGGAIFEADDGEEEESIREEIEELFPEGDDEEESRSSGPFYF